MLFTDKDANIQDVLLRVTKLFGSRADRFECEEMYSLLYPLPRDAHTPPFSSLSHRNRLRDACIRESSWLLYAYTNDPVICRYECFFLITKRVLDLEK